MLATKNELQLISSISAGKSRVALRQNLPLHYRATVERCLGEGRFLVSGSISKMNLQLFQQQLNEEFSRLEEYAGIDKPNHNIKPGELYLYRDSSLEVFRARILQVGNGVSCRLIDFGLCVTANHNNFYSFSEIDFEQFRSLPPFVSRVNLPTDEVLRDLGLPIASMIKEGDLVDIIVFTTTEPQLAVFSFAESVRHLMFAENFTGGFDTQASDNWKALFSEYFLQSEPRIFRYGFGHLINRDFHINRLALIAHVKALDKVYVHDLDCAIRLFFLRLRLNLIYRNENVRPRLVIHDFSELSVGAGCVAYHSDTSLYVRVEVVSIGLKEVEVAPIDMPNLGTFSVTKEFLFKAQESLLFPRQCFVVRMTRHSNGQHRHYLSQLARCVLPDKTPVILNSEPTVGLVKIHCSNAPQGVLAKIGFTAIKQSKFSAEVGGTKLEKKFGVENFELVVPEIENLNIFAARTTDTKKENK